MSCHKPPLEWKVSEKYKLELFCIIVQYGMDLVPSNEGFATDFSGIWFNVKKVCSKWGLSSTPSKAETWP